MATFVRITAHKERQDELLTSDVIIDFERVVAVYPHDENKDKSVVVFEDKDTMILPMRVSELWEAMAPGGGITL